MIKAMICEYEYPSFGAGNIYVRCWHPTMEPIGIVQIVHGIAEHTERYDAFAESLNAIGYLVVAQDHMGHGKSQQPDQPLGYFHGGWFAAVDDTYQLLKDTATKYPGIPYILFGHSMGSFIVRSILGRYPDCAINGCIICGTGWMPDAVLSTGCNLAKLICRIRGDQYQSKLLQTMMFGGYNRRIEHPRTPFDWLTRDNSVVNRYLADPKCGFIPCAGLARDMLTGLQYIQTSETLTEMNSDLPVLFISGGDDPVGDFGAGVKKAADVFQRYGMLNVSVKLYPLCRHEILNELNRAEIYQDIINWIREI